MKNFWNKLSEKKPFSYKTGDWDGKISDEILFVNKNGYFYTGKYYEGVMEGREFCCFFDNNDYEIRNVTHWAEIPILF